MFTPYNRLATVLAGAVLTASAVSAGCATTTLTRQDLLRQYDTVAELSDSLEDVRGRDGALLAPGLFEKAERQLSQALDATRDGEEQEAKAAAQRGLQEVKQLNETMANNRRVMEEVLDIRERASLQGAAVLFEERFGDADEHFRDASRLLEENELDAARTARPALIEEYAKLELEALKKGTVEAAKQAIAAAEEADAGKLAPKTLQSAREELELALSVLDADRTQVEKSNAYAKHAAWLANRAHAIVDLTQYFESQDFSDEDLALWYQAQLQRVRNAMRDETLPFDQSNAQVIEALRADSLALKSVMKDIQRTNEMVRMRAAQLESDLEAQRLAHEAELQGLLDSREQERIAAIKQRLSATALAKAEAERRERRSQERFEQTQSLFDPGEAEVFRKGNNMLIRLQGFGFKPGKYEVEARNYGLLNKVVAAINTFPGSSVQITGHTDTRGNEKRNVELSAARAQSVVNFLSMVGGVDEGRLTAGGKGEEQPLASNETAEGRSKNRRIDVLIVNDPPVAEGSTSEPAKAEEAGGAVVSGAAASK